ILGSSLFENAGGNEPDQLHLIIACVVLAFAFSTIYSKLAGGGHSLSHGAQFGLWVGIFIGFGERWFDYAFQMYPTSLNDSIISGVMNIVFFTILGVLASLVYGKMSSSE
ncbi:hypothetical protein JYT89_03655, partial [Flavobacteriaceae bacterium AH-315-B10]|nr:hypothetical protein [Flavobacteriaceae bacterium AH-315-B10]